MKYSIIFSLLFVSLTLANTTPATQVPFSSKLFYTIAKEKSSENIILSPVSISSCLALVYLGAGGSTAAELKNTLQLGGESKEASAEIFNEILTKTKESEEAKLKIANRIYMDQKFQIAPKYNEIAERYFKAAAETLDFSKSTQAANAINSWVEEQTENKIQNLISPNSLNENTAAVLVNAIYFKANWTKPFKKSATQKQNFALSKTNRVEVEMMSQMDRFLYSDLKNLNAIAVELSYRDTDLAMLVILPKNIDGLAALEAKLNYVDLTKLSENFTWEQVRLKLPKFKFEFDISLQPALEKLGIKKMFTKQANFSELLSTKQNLTVSEAMHKAIIGVNEFGTEAAAATFIAIALTSAISEDRVYDFVADHPFFFAIKDRQNIYFAGHVAKF